MRPSWDRHWMAVAHLAAEMSTCASGRKVGAAFVKDKRLVATGFNGVPSGYPHPTSCPRRELGVPSGQRLDLCVCAHAEANGITNAARHGLSLEGASVYVTVQPCAACMGALANVGVRRVVFGGHYPDERSKEIAHYAGMELICLEPENGADCAPPPVVVSPPPSRKGPTGEGG